MNEADLKETIFRTVVLSRIREDFEEALWQADFSEENVEEYQQALLNLPEDKASKIFTTPWEIRGRFLREFKAKIDHKEATVTDMVNQLYQMAEKKGYELGFHLTSKDIEPSQGARGPEWDIVGYDFDDRDERPMAYYSLDYKNLFRKKRGTNLYVVRAETGPETTHKRDTSNNWGRAGRLAIIERMNVGDIDDEVEAALKELKKEKSEEEAA